MDAYLADLPRGLDAYPEFVQKASIYRQVFSRGLSDKLTPILPPPLAGLLTEPLPVSTWVPEVQVNALMIALFENMYRGDEAQFIEDGLETARKLFRSPLYRTMMMLISPAVIVSRASSRWDALHRGIQLCASMSSDAGASFRVDFPSRLVPRVVALTYTSAFHAALEAAGAKEVRCSLTSLTPEQATYQATWRARSSSMPP